MECLVWACKPTRARRLLYNNISHWNVFFIIFFFFLFLLSSLVLVVFREFVSNLSMSVFIYPFYIDTFLYGLLVLFIFTYTAYNIVPIQLPPHQHLHHVLPPSLLPTYPPNSTFHFLHFITFQRPQIDYPHPPLFRIHEDRLRLIAHISIERTFCTRPKFTFDRFVSKLNVNCWFSIFVDCLIIYSLE